MSELKKLVAPTSNVNDTSVVIYEFLVEDKSKVTAGTDVVSIETSKTTQALAAPCDGFIKFLVASGDEVPNGEALAVFADTLEELENVSVGKKTTAPSSASSPVTSSAASSSAASAVSSMATAATSGSYDMFGSFDVAVTLGEIMVPDSTYAEAGQLLCRVRKANEIVTVSAPRAGYVFWKTKPYETVKPGNFIGAISDSNVAPAALNSAYNSLRLSKTAADFLSSNGLSAAMLGLSGLITIDDIKNKLGIKSTETTPDSPAAPAFHSTTGNMVKLSKAKRSEAEFLARANKDVVSSQVSILVPTNGIFSAGMDDSELARRFSGIMIMEVSKLLRDYPVINSVYEKDSLFEYDKINVGYALSIDDGLKVPVFRECDNLSLEDILAKKDEFIEKYITRTLTSDDLAEGTFTITDLSSSGCFMFNPVLNLGQSAILGVGGENPAHTEYPLILAYDHRVVDGATAMDFLCALRDRLIAHENVLLAENTEPEYEDMPLSEEIGQSNAMDSDIITPETLSCDFCFKTPDQLGFDEQFFFRVIDKYGKTKCICPSCMRGW